MNCVCVSVMNTVCKLLSLLTNNLVNFNTNVKYSADVTSIVCSSFCTISTQCETRVREVQQGQNQEAEEILILKQHLKYLVYATYFEFDQRASELLT